MSNANYEVIMKTHDKLGRKRPSLAGVLLPSGSFVSVEELVERSGCSYQVVANRVRLGWAFADVVSVNSLTPVKLTEDELKLFSDYIDQAVKHIKLNGANGLGYSLAHERINARSQVMLVVGDALIHLRAFSKHRGVHFSTISDRIRNGVPLQHLFHKGTLHTRYIESELVISNPNPLDAVYQMFPNGFKRLGAPKKKKVAKAERECKQLSAGEFISGLIDELTVKESILVGRSKLFPAQVEGPLYARCD